jgi:hypothetical protein
MYASVAGDLLLGLSLRGVSEALRESLGRADDLRGESSSLYCVGVAYRTLYAAAVGAYVSALRIPG